MAALDRVEQPAQARFDRDGRRRLARRVGADGPRSWSSTSRASRTTPAPAASSPFVPAEKRDVTGPGHGADGPAELRGEVGRRERAGALGGLDDDGQRREAGDDPVAGDEAPAERGEARRQLGHDAAALDDPRVEAAARRRVRHVGARRRGRRPGAAASRARRTARRERAGASSARRPDGPAASASCSSAPTCAAESTPIAMPGDHRHAGGGEAAAERARDLEPVGRAAAGADDRDARRPARARAGRPRRAAPRAGPPARAAARDSRARSGRPRSARPRRSRARAAAGAKPA